MSWGKMSLVWLLLAAATGSLWSQSELEKRLTAMDMTQNSQFEGKKFDAKKSLANKTFDSGSANLNKKFATETFDSKTFAGQKPDTAAKQTFRTSSAAQQEKKFATESAAVSEKSFASRDYSQQSKTVSNADKTAPTRKMDPEGKTDGYWKAFKERLDKDLSMEEVRELLNKTK